MRVNVNSTIQGVTEVLPKAKTAPVTAPTSRLEADQVAFSRTEALRQAMDRTPVVRADKVAQAKALVADPAYPSDALINRLAGLLAKEIKSTAQP